MHGARYKEEGSALSQRSLHIEWVLDFMYGLDHRSNSLYRYR